MIEVKANTGGKVIVNGSDIGQLKNDFDRVTAERDALQALLTAADERAYRLESGIKWEAERNALLLASLTEAEDMLSVTSLEGGQHIDLLEGLLREASVELHDFITGPLLDRVDAALKPVNGDCHHGYASILECPECGAPYQ